MEKKEKEKGDIYISGSVVYFWFYILHVHILVYLVMYANSGVWGSRIVSSFIHTGALSYIISPTYI